MQKIKVFLVIIVVFFVITTAVLSAQSMEIVDNLLSEETAQFGDSVYMIAVGSGLTADSISVSEAVDLITENGWNASRKSAEQPISLGELSFIIMQSMNIEGGIMYSLMPSPRYAVRELEFLGLITGEAHPDNTVPGEDVIKILSNAINMKEAE